MVLFCFVSLPVFTVNHKSMKCDVSFSQGSLSTIFRRARHFFHTCVKKFLLFTTMQKLRKSMEIFQSHDHRCTAAFFLIHSVHSVCQSQRVSVWSSSGHGARGWNTREEGESAEDPRLGTDITTWEAGRHGRRLLQHRSVVVGGQPTSKLHSYFVHVCHSSVKVHRVFSCSYCY